MSLRPTGLGAEPKKVAILIGLIAVAGGTYYWMSRPDVPAGITQPAPATSAVSAKRIDNFLRPEDRYARPDIRFRRRFPSHAEAAGGSGCESNRSHAAAG
jgi:hypothetical protein